MATVVRATIVFWLLWFLLRAAGKRELAEMTAFELILLMVMGDLIQQGVTQEDMSVTGAAMSVSTMMLWSLVLSYVAFRSRRAAGLLESRPAIVIRDGEIDREMLRLQRLTVDELLEAARTEGIASLAQVRWAILESDGKLSFVSRPPSAATS